VAQGNITTEEAHQFAQQVIDRFKNPYIEHLWLSITVQYTSKMAMRTVPLVEKHYAINNETPNLMALGFAAFLLFMRSTIGADNLFYGENNGATYRIQDDKANLLHDQWMANGINTIAANTLQDRTIFGIDLNQYPGFTEAVNRNLELLVQDGAVNAVRSILAKKSVA
jgi:tagaturonate reductase